MSDTIYALSSGNGPAGVAVIRVSGSGVQLIIDRFCRRELKPRQAELCTLFHPFNDQQIDQALVLSILRVRRVLPVKMWLSFIFMAGGP